VNEPGLSLKKLHYYIRAIIGNRLVRVNNFKSSNNIRAHVYALTGRGAVANYAGGSRWRIMRKTGMFR